jgi:hypothetical protein
MRYRSYCLFMVFLFSFLASCSSGSLTNLTEEVRTEEGIPSSTPKKASPTINFSPTTEYTSTTTPTSAPTLTPTITPTPTVTPTLTPTPIIFDGSVIDESNFTNLKKYATLGKGSIDSIDVSEDGKIHIIKTARGIFLYETETLQLLDFLEDYGFYSLIPGKSQIIALTPALTLTVIDIVNGSLLNELQPTNVLGIKEIVFSKDNSHIAVIVLQPHSTRQDWTSYRIDIWNLVNGELVNQLESELVGPCFSLAFSLDNNQLISECYPSGGGYPKLFHWNIQKGSLSWYVSNEGHFTSFPFSRDGSLLATYTMTQYVVPDQVIIRRTSDGAEVGRVNGKVGDNPFSLDNKHIVTSSKYDISVWHVTSSQRVKKIASDLDWPLVSYSDDGQYILANNGKMAWRVSDFSLDETFPEPQEASEIQPLSIWRTQGHLSGIKGVDLFKDDHLFIWGISDDYDAGRIRTLWWWYPNQNIYEEIPLGEFSGQPALSPSKDKMAVCTQEGLKIITIDDRYVDDFGPCRSSSAPVVFSGDGKRLFVGLGIIIDEFDIETRSVLGQLRGHNHNIGDIKSSDDGKYLFSSSADEIQGGRECIIWELDPNTFIHKWSITAGSRSDLSDAIFSKDNANLIAIFGSEVTVWRISDRWYLANFEGSAIALTPDDKLAVIGKPDYSLDFYDTNNWKKYDSVGEIISNQENETDPSYFFFKPLTGIIYLDFIMQGRILISVTSEDVIDLWRVP